MSNPNNARHKIIKKMRRHATRPKKQKVTFGDMSEASSTPPYVKNPSVPCRRWQVYDGSIFQGYRTRREALQADKKLAQTRDRHFSRIVLF
jgi:hypothetical protein